MSWVPPDSHSDLVLQQIITRARERVLGSFAEERRRIESEQAARGVLGGPVLHRCGQAAATAIQSFGSHAVAELLAALTDVCNGPPVSDALEWCRATLHSNIDGLVAGLGSQIDALRTGGGVKGAAQRLDPAARAAKRDVDIEIGKAGIRFRVSPARSVRPTHVNSVGPMYSLLVSGNADAWAGSPWILDGGRFLKFTDDEVKKMVGDFGTDALGRLLRLPCILAYERICKKDPLFGVVRRVVPRGSELRVEYAAIPTKSFLTQEQLEALAGPLSIEWFEYSHTHWAVKEVDLGRVLVDAGITLPPAADWQPPVNVTNHHFDVGLSFPSEVRGFVKAVADALESVLGSHRYFYDNNYKAQLARPDLDLLLQDIYGNRSRLIVVFLSDAYDKKEWCGVEFRAIREIIKARGADRIMFVRMDEGAVKGTFSLDGAVDARTHSPEEIAQMICERVTLLR